MQAVKWVKNGKLRNYWDLIEMICSWWNYLFFPLGKCVIRSNCGTLSTASGSRLTSLVEFFGTAGRNCPGAERGCIIRTGYRTGGTAIVFSVVTRSTAAKTPCSPKSIFPGDHDVKRYTCKMTDRLTVTWNLINNKSFHCRCLSI